MIVTRLDVLLGPAEIAAFARCDQSDAVCVVFDVLRATSSMVAALSSGAERIVPVAEIPEALELRERDPAVLLAGERQGLRIRAELTGGVDFDFGNSPREFTPERVRGRTLVMTTTNGTRAIRACAGARAVLVAGFLNLGATIAWLRERRPARLVLVCSGTEEEPALEDVLAAGAVCEELSSLYAAGHASDAAEIARRMHASLGSDLAAAMRSCRNGRRLLSIPELRDDVRFCVQRDAAPFAAGVDAAGAVRVLA